jgi:hypothetical protein
MRGKERQQQKRNILTGPFPSEAALSLVAGLMELVKTINQPWGLWELGLFAWRALGMP